MNLFNGMGASRTMSAASSFSTWVVELLSIFPPALIFIVISMMPLIELRGTILLWSAQGSLTGLESVFAGFPYPGGWLQIYIVSVIGNMIPIPLLLMFFPRVEKWLRRWAFFNRFFDKLFERTKKKSSASVEKYEEIALLLFVALPLPITGAWTGSLVAYLFGLDRSKSLFFIFLGVLCAGAIMLTLVLISLWVAVAIIAAMTLLLVAMGKMGSKGEKDETVRSSS